MGCSCRLRCWSEVRTYHPAYFFGSASISSEMPSTSKYASEFHHCTDPQHAPCSAGVLTLWVRPLASQISNNLYDYSLAPCVCYRIWVLATIFTSRLKLAGISISNPRSAYLVSLSSYVGVHLDILMVLACRIKATIALMLPNTRCPAPVCVSSPPVTWKRSYRCMQSSRNQYQISKGSQLDFGNPSRWTACVGTEMAL